jgi:hypothetical protein
MKMYKLSGIVKNITYLKIIRIMDYFKKNDKGNSLENSNRMSQKKFEESQISV